MAQGFESLHLEVILQVEPEARGRVRRGDPAPRPVGLQLPCIGLVQQCRIEDPDQALLDQRVFDGDRHLDPPIEVPFHQVG
jgi:hypothetical protein